MRNFTLPLTQKDIESLTAGEMITLTGKMYTARDAAHKRLVTMLQNGEELPLDLRGQAIYFAGPCFDENKKITAIGPTTSMRMDAFSPILCEYGAKVMIGKGDRNSDVYEAIKSSKGIYLAAIGGAGAIYANCVKSYKTICFEDLGSEAIRELEMEEFPCIVAIDYNGNSVY